eukprot:comp19749_c0_seq1/m.23586 comp19749_c0_seq1/g.23586  ORF comp19749_c0_seq1/g.23586 comp19749_c0_seq1/m.23586 type:complete len:469 (-) comp19749_c0_seq1:568-1974(-)
MDDPVSSVSIRAASPAPSLLDYGIHKAVFANDAERVMGLLGKDPTEETCALVNAKDHRGNTPLHIAVMKGAVKCVDILLEHGAKVREKNGLGWTSLEEAVSYGHRDMLRTIYVAHKRQVKARMKERTPTLLRQVESLGDFYLELDWRVHSWVPFVSKACPSDTYRVRKKGTCVRVDTTLVGFSELKWQRGNISFLFRLDTEGKERFAVMDNDKKLYQWLTKDKGSFDEYLEENLDHMMGGYIGAVSISTKTITLTPAKKGPLWAQKPRRETIGPYSTDVYSVENCVAVMRKRKEHLSEEDLKRRKQALSQMRRVTESEKSLSANLSGDPPKPQHRQSLPPPPPPPITEEEYFNPSSTSPVHLGRPINLKETRKALYPKVWMAESFPLATDTVLKILQIVAPSNRHFDKLASFIDAHLPPGFPIRLDIPIFPTISAMVTFQDYRAEELDASLFVIPSDYREDDTLHQSS